MNTGPRGYSRLRILRSSRPALQCIYWGFAGDLPGRNKAKIAIENPLPAIAERARIRPDDSPTSGFARLVVARPLDCPFFEF
jgi:hypothetical protein